MLLTLIEIETKYHNPGLKGANYQHSLEFRIKGIVSTVSIYLVEDKEPFSPLKHLFTAIYFFKKIKKKIAIEKNCWIVEFFFKKRNFNIPQFETIEIGNGI